MIRLFCLLALFAGNASADTDTPWFSVEILAFAHLTDAAPNEESWDEDPGQPSLLNALEPGRFPTVTAASGTPLAAFALLERPERLLNRERDYMRRSRHYRPLLHIAWRQPGFSRQLAKTLHLASDMDSRNGKRTDSDPLLLAGNPLGQPLEGTARVYLERYLHLELDLLYSMTSDQADTPGSGVLSNVASQRQFRLTESRRMRAGELHYFDHPMFGVLALITRVEADQPDTP